MVPAREAAAREYVWERAAAAGRGEEDAVAAAGRSLDLAERALHAEWSARGGFAFSSRARARSRYPFDLIAQTGTAEGVPRSASHGPGGAVLARTSLRAAEEHSLNEHPRPRRYRSHSSCRETRLLRARFAKRALRSTAHSSAQPPASAARQVPGAAAQAASARSTPRAQKAAAHNSPSSPTPRSTPRSARARAAIAHPYVCLPVFRLCTRLCTHLCTHLLLCSAKTTRERDGEGQGTALQEREPSPKGLEAGIRADDEVTAPGVVVSAAPAAPADGDRSDATEEVANQNTKGFFAFWRSPSGTRIQMHKIQECIGEN